MSCEKSDESIMYEFSKRNVIKSKKFENKFF